MTAEASGHHNPSARVTLIKSPTALPGCCVLCGKSTHPVGFANTDGLDFEFYGAVFFCGDCVGDYARLFGYIHPDEAEKLRERVRIAEDTAFTLGQSLTNLGELDVAIRHYIDNNTSSVVNNVVNLSVEGNNLLEQSASTESAEREGLSDSGDETNGEFTESLIVEGSDDVPSTRSDGIDIVSSILG